MPIATPQGTLDFKSVDTITFVGASSNTVIDTTTGSLGVGVDVNGPTSNLHVVGNALITGNVADLNVVSNVNMLHTSNTASIKLNSNVVTEFPRSKKLIKYPREAIPGNNSAVSSAYTYSASDGDYVIRASSEYDYRFYASNAFDSNLTTNAWLSGPGGTRYNSGSPETSDSVASSTFTKFGAYGEWLELKIPTSIYLNYVVVYPKDTRVTSKITSAIVWGSNTGTDGAWQRLSTISGVADYTESNPLKISIDSHVLYNYYALQITSINPIPTQYAVVNELQFYGTPEYDPEAHGVDVVIKSLPNVPNTDWLEVYYDAKNYTSGVVQDLSTNSFNGTLTNGASFNNSDGIDKFVFDGSNDYISGSIPSTFTGNQTYTFSTWIKPDSHPSGFVGVFGIGTNSANDSIGFFLNSGNILHLTYGNNLETTTVATIGQWVHITGTYTSGDRRVYANGNLLKQDDYSGLTLAGTTFKLGSNLLGTQPFDGSIANFRLFNRVLTPDEIYQVYAYQKEYFGHGVLGMTLKNGRLGIGTSEPKAALDVRGDIAGPFHTFLTGDVTTSSSTSFTANHQVKALNSFTFDVPKEYNSYGTANLEVFGQVKWSGEVEYPWNTVLKLRLYYGNLTTQIIHSVENPEAGTNNRGCGMIAISNHSDNGSTLDSAIASSKFLIPNCPVGPGSQLKLEILIQQGNSTSTVYTNRTTGSTTTDVNYERGTTNFFMALKVV